jgi:hypothetical protein
VQRSGRGSWGGRDWGLRVEDGGEVSLRQESLMLKGPPWTSSYRKDGVTESFAFLGVLEGTL